MRVRDNFKEEPKKELRKKVVATLIGTALVVGPPIVVHKIDQNKMEMMQSTYEILLEESTKNAYLEGFIDGLLGVDDKFYIYTNNNSDLVINESEIDTQKKLIFTKK